MTKLCRSVAPVLNFITIIPCYSVCGVGWSPRIQATQSDLVLPARLAQEPLRQHAGSQIIAPAIRRPSRAISTPSSACDLCQWRSPSADGRSMAERRSGNDRRCASAPGPAPGYHSAGRFPSEVGVVIAASGCPPGEAGCSAGRVVHAAQTQPAHRRLLMRHLEMQPDRGSGSRFLPFASTANRRVPSAVRCMRQWLTITTFAAQAVPAAVDGVHLPGAAHRTGRSAPTIGPGAFQRSTAASG